MKQFILYLLRWQATGVILGLCIEFLNPHLGVIWTTVAANLIGGLAFVNFDKAIFQAEKKSTKRLLVYLLRWQASGIILAPCIDWLLPYFSVFWTTILSNLIGGIIIFPIDKFIFTKKWKA